MSRLISSLSLLLCMFLPGCSIANEPTEYEFYYENRLGGKIRIHDQETCNDPTVMSNTPPLLKPMMTYATSVDKKGIIQYRACVLIDPIKRSFTFIWLDDYSTVTYPASKAKRNTDATTLPKRTVPRSIPYRPDYFGPFFYSA